jgi:hypothetical protein
MLTKKLFLCLIFVSLIFILLFTFLNDENTYIYNSKPEEDINQIVNILNINYYVILSANLDDLNTDFYFYYLPITCTSWRRIFYEPIVILISSDFNSLNSLSQLTLKYLNDLNIKTIKIKASKEFNVFISMVSRIFVGLIDDAFISDEDFVITSDTDIIPFDKSYYFGFKPESDIVLWNAYCCGSFEFQGDTYDMYPLSHIGMRKKHWKQVMNIEFEDYGKLDTETIMKILKNVHGESEVYDGKTAIQRGDKFWYFDQVTISVNIVKNGKKLNKYKINYEGIRQERGQSQSKWLENLDKIRNDLTDFHLFQSDVFQKRNSMYRLFEFLFSDEQNESVNYFKNYTDTFFELRKKNLLQNSEDIGKILKRENLYDANEVLFLSKLYQKILNDPMKYIRKYVKLPFDYGFGSNSIPLTITSLLTTGDVLELGMGFFSTPLLHNVTSDYSRQLISVDTKFEWLSKFLDFNNTKSHRVYLVNTETIVNYGLDKKWGLVLVDHSTAGTRYLNIISMADKAQVVVAHDAEKPSDHMYKYEEKNVKKFYKYACKFSIYTSEDNSWYYSTLILSNWYDVRILRPIFDQVYTDYGHFSCDLNF